MTNKAIYTKELTVPKQETRVEPALLIQPLTDEGQQGLSELTALCQKEMTDHGEAVPHGACTRYASIFGEIWHAVKHAWHVIKKAAKKVAQTVHQVYLSVRAWYNLNVSFIHHWECTIDGGGIGILAGIGTTAAAGPWASGFIGTAAGTATAELCERA